MIRIDHLTKRYRTVTAVDDFSFEVGPGRVTGFLGPNGAGKTTTLRMLLGLAGPDDGTATINPRAEADWIARALRAQVVMVPEAAHYPQSQRPDITTGAVLRFLESVQGRA